MSWTKNAIRVTVLAAGFAVAGAGAAAADTTNGDFSVLGGNQLYAPISAPINLSGNSAALLGKAKAASYGGAHVTNVNSGGMTTSGKFSIGGGNQLNAPISVPVNICGNTLAAGAVTKAACGGSATVTNRNTGGGMTTSGKFSLVGGNQAYIPVSVPVNVCGNSAAVLGVAKAYCKGGAHVLNEGTGSGSTTSGKFSGVGGNQAYVPLSAPINVCGNSAAGLGVTKAACKATATVTNAETPVLPSTKRVATSVREVLPADHVDGDEQSMPLNDTLGAVQGLLKSAPRPADQAAAPAAPAVAPETETVPSLTQGLPLSVGGFQALR